MIKGSTYNLSWFRIFTKKEQSYQNNSEKSCTEKKAIYEPSGWAMFTSCSFDEKKNELNYHRGKDCIEKLFKKLKKRAMKIINYKKRNDTSN